MKHLTQLIVLVLLLALSLTQCAKNKELELSKLFGNIYDQVSGDPIEGAKVCLTRTYSSPWAGPAPTCENYHVYTNSEGYYNLKFSEEDNYFYGINIAHDNYVDVSASASAGGQGELNRVNIDMARTGDLALTLKNVNFFNVYDKVELTTEYSSTTLYGMQDTTLHLEAIGEIENNIVWKLTRNGTITVHTLPLLCAGHDSTFYTLEY